VEVVAETAEEIYGMPPVVLPTQADTGSRYVVCGPFRIPAIVYGANKHIRIADCLHDIGHIALHPPRRRGGGGAVL
jgi:hypothetical protein